MTFNHLNRRTHLYLALALIPWFIIYGFTSVFFSHPSWVGSMYDDGVPMWTKTGEFAFDGPAPEMGAELREIADRIGAKSGLDGPFGAWRPGPKRIHVYPISFLDGTRLTYFPEDKKVVVDEKRFRWDHFFTSLHARGGYQNDAFLHDLWAFLVDGVCIAFLIWIASGIYMWWLLPGCRKWGAVSLGGGICCFIAFLIWL